MITNNFQRVLGRVGFGYIYDGFLEDGTQAQILSRIHHKNLVSMIGYCKDGEYMALVYEYMSEGTLQEHIEGSNRNGACLTWTQRLRIALESAQASHMTDVVAQLQEYVELENGRVGGNTNNGFHGGSSGDDPNLSYDAYTTDRSTSVSQNSTTFEMEYNVIRVPTMPTGPATRLYFYVSFPK
ncbi:probable LRR receptor-like serine/threonine-protein kinase At1g51880 [Aegilops tauschii subsp. strangulata]|uniref:probable LRR receptor-like serine/threonine-protein kinase At1g51880 n=1 Tax=Aegilops tauschii subsp. strangulata TaxID=200361 RepID=UPI003CC873E5